MKTYKLTVKSTADTPEVLREWLEDFVQQPRGPIIELETVVDVPENCCEFNSRSIWHHDESCKNYEVCY
jgi:hypothetical protein